MYYSHCTVQHIIAAQTMTESAANPQMPGVAVRQVSISALPSMQLLLELYENGECFKKVSSSTIVPSSGPASQTEIAGMRCLARYYHKRTPVGSALGIFCSVYKQAAYTLGWMDGWIDGSMDGSRDSYIAGTIPLLISSSPVMSRCPRWAICQQLLYVKPHHPTWHSYACAPTTLLGTCTLVHFSVLLLALFAAVHHHFAATALLQSHLSRRPDASIGHALSPAHIGLSDSNLDTA